MLKARKRLVFAKFLQNVCKSYFMHPLASFVFFFLSFFIWVYLFAKNDPPLCTPTACALRF